MQSFKLTPSLLADARGAHQAGAASRSSSSHAERGDGDGSRCQRRTPSRRSYATWPVPRYKTVLAALERAPGHRPQPDASPTVPTARRSSARSTPARRARAGEYRVRVHLARPEPHGAVAAQLHPGQRPARRERRDGARHEPAERGCDRRRAGGRRGGDRAADARAHGAGRMRLRSWRSRRCRFACRSRPTAGPVNLLIPLYLVVAAGVLAFLARRLGCARDVDDDGSPRPGSDAEQHGVALTHWRGWLSVRGLRWLLSGPSRCTRCRSATRATARRRPRTSCSSTCPSRCCSGCCARCAGRAGSLLRCLAVAVGLAVVFAGRRVRRVLPQGAVPEPEGRRGQPVRQLFPGQLALLRPEHLRALPGARDDRGDDRRAVERAPARRGDRRRRRSPGCWRGS